MSNPIDLREQLTTKLDFLKPNPNDYAEEAGYNDAAGNFEELLDELLSLISDTITAAKPEKRQSEADKLRAQGHRIVGSSPYIDDDNATYNQALDDYEQRLTNLLGKDTHDTEK